MYDNKFKNAIVITGGISSGKSTVGSLLKLYGYLIIDADEISHKILDNNYEKIIDFFGEEYVQNKKVLRKKLGKKIFSNIEDKKKLEKLLHPLIKEEIIKKAKNAEMQNKPYFIEIPLFFETKNYNIKNVLLVYVSEEIQLQRLIKRDKISLEEAKEKILNQINIEKKKEKSNIIIDNSKDLKHLQNEIQRVIGEINELYKI